MSVVRGGLGAPVVWRSAAQGDILAINEMEYWAGSGRPLESVATPHGVVLLSQTCDLVQDRARVLAAPVSHCTDAEFAQIVKGRKPLLVVVGSGTNQVADLELLQSVPRSALDGAIVTDHTTGQRSGDEAARFAARIARGIARFAFPDEVHEALRKFHRKIVDSYTKSTSFAEVLALVDEFRAACPDWNAAGRDLSIYAVVPSRHLPAADMRPPGWIWSPTSVHALRPSERPQELSLERISELLIINLREENDSAVVALWELWAEALLSGVQPSPSAEVESISLEAVSGADFRYDQYTESAALDFSALSLTDQSA